jgi:hypothetical protein
MENALNIRVTIWESDGNCLVGQFLVCFGWLIFGLILFGWLKWLTHFWLAGDTKQASIQRGLVSLGRGTSKLASSNLSLGHFNIS